ncbi:MAG TPA: acyl-CoA dehydrogenase family protein [Candidatus Krumholzibacteria bacterium]|nr:acyl-CoA dehydrogenase family protein [Candidatus Krumholzibacteria bacterium]HPD71430.1 acyl-CoA dehydrogenase family protein [Candidatus Krumholzibacteria bacterium]HRY41637.1 acyl-CoA dehydrogenase family protein [Candidatus Krumholzibacteria bacterium]
MKPYQGVDFFRVSRLLDAEERAVQAMARQFVERSFLPVLRAHHAAGTFPTEIVPELGALGLLGPSVRGPGCSGLSYTVYGLICEELERGDSGLRSFASVQGSLVMWPISVYGTDEQRAKYLPELARGKLVGCFGLTEAAHGSDPAGMETRCRRDGDGWVLSGNKMWITNATLADLAVVWARDEADGKVRGFLLEKGDSGFAAQAIHGKYSLRASDTGELILDEVRVRDSRRLPGVEGLKGPLSCLNEARYGIAWGVVGAAADCYHTALAYALEREQFSTPIAGFQLTQAKLVDMLTDVTQGQLVAIQLGRLKDSGVNEFPLVSLAKRRNVAMALDVARSARSILGAAGITDEYSPGRHLTNLESVYTYEGTHEIHTLIVGQAITGLAAYR